MMTNPANYTIAMAPLHCRLRTCAVSLAGAFLVLTAPRIANADEPQNIDAKKSESATNPSSSSRQTTSSTSNSTRTAGTVLMVMGCASVATGVVVIAWTFGLADTNQPGRDYAGIAGLSLMGGGMLLDLIGIPLYLAGGNGSKAQGTPPGSPVTVSAGFGVGSASLKVTF